MKNKIGFGAILLCLGVAFSQETYSQWSSYKVLTLNTASGSGGASVSGAVANFPLLVRLSSANFDVFTQAAAGGADIRFSAADGTTPLKYERDRWDAANQLAEFWVLVPSIAGNATTTIRMYWGKSGAADSSKSTAVFDTSNAYRGVWHLGKGSPGSATVLDSDATANASHLKWIHGTTAETTSVIRGNISRADSLPNVNNTGTTSNFLSVSSNPSFVIGSSNGMTLSAWVKRTGKGGGTPTNPVSSDEGIAMRFRFTATANNGRVWGLEYTPATKGGPVSNAGSGDYNTHGNGYSFHYATDGSGTTANEKFLCSGVVDSGNWDHLVATETATTQALWVNGVLVATDNQSTTNLDIPNTIGAGGAGNAAFTIAKLDSADNTYNQTFNGVIDEVELQRTVRDSNWIKLSYATQKPTVTALTLGVTQNGAAATAPIAPTGATATAGNSQASVTWTASSNGGSAITGYTVTSNPGSFTCTTTGSIGCTVTGLTNGLPYTFTVTATNAVGTSAASSPSSAVTPTAVANVPSAPTNPAGVAGNTTVTVSWTAATANGSAITGYIATSNPDGKTCTTTGTSCVDSNLTNGTSYTFTVVATSAAGPSPASAVSAAVVPKGPPSAPMGATGVPGNGQVAVSWAVPLSSGGSAITNYTVSTSPDTSKHCTTTGALTCNVTGLVNGTQYTFTVKATNVVGTGPASIASGAVTPLSVPDAPTGVTGAGSAGQVTVSWLSPVNNGGAAITGYTATSSPETKTCTTNGALNCIITGLTNTTSYTFTVKATNTAGTSAASLPSSAVTNISTFSSKGIFGFETTPSAVVFQIPEGVKGNLTATDIWGREVWNRTVGNEIHSIAWDKKSAAPGVYIVRFISRNGDKVKLAAESKILLTP